MSIANETDNGVIYTTPTAAIKLFDDIAKTNLGMSGADFIRRWDRGDYDGVDWDAIPGLAEVAIAVPFAR